MKQKPMLSNLVLNFIRTFLNLLFPVVTFSYASRVLGEKGIGIVSYTDSIVRYLVLIGGSGISFYAMREAAGVREKKEVLAGKVRELSRLILCLTGISYLLLLALLFVGIGKEYTSVLLVQSGIVLFNAVGMEWLYHALEEYRYIAVRTAFFQGIACIFLFLFVRENQDYLLYALIVTGASAGMQIMNFITISRRMGMNVFGNMATAGKHWGKAKYVFGANFAISIYVHMDKTMLGNMLNMESVGLYSAAHNIIQAAAGLLTCVTNVMLPRVSFYLNEGKEKEAEALLKKTGNRILVFTVPAAIGTICVGRELLVLLSGEKFIQSYATLALLSAGMLFSVYNNFCIWQILIPYKREKEVFYGTLFSAVMNVCLNSLLIPAGGMEGAAVATVAAEMVLLLYCRRSVREYQTAENRICCLIQCLIAAGTGIGISSFLIESMATGVISSLVLKVSVSLVLYPGILWLCKNKEIRQMIKELRVLLIHFQSNDSCGQ